MQTLANLTRGNKAKVLKLPTDERHLRKLMAFGILPGIEVDVLQTSPSFVINVGNTRLAIDRDIARGISVSTK